MTPTTVASTTRGFVHLHVHTEFSKQDGLARVKKLTQRVSDHGMPAVAMTDHGNVGGAWKFHLACEAAGVKPIMGIEAYMALAHGPETYVEVDPPAGSKSTAKIQVEAPDMAWNDPQVRFTKMVRFEPDAESGKVKKNSNNHITLLARNEQGWRNLVTINNEAQRSIYNKPLMDYALLQAHSEGLIVLSGCLGGPVASRVSMANAALRDVGLEPDVTLDPESPNGLLVSTKPSVNDPQGLISRARDAANRAETEARSTAWKADAILLHDDKVAQIRDAAAAKVVAATDEERAAAVERFAVNIDQARVALDHLVECVGVENVYVEIMEHGLEAEGINHIRVLTTLSDAAGTKIVATNDSHYVDCDEHAHHDEWLFAGDLARAKSGKAPDFSDPDRWRFNGSGYHLRSEQEMRSIYAGKRWQEACDNTVDVAARIEDNVLPMVDLRLPVFDVPKVYRDEWEAGEDTTFTDAAGVVHPAKIIGAGKVYRTPSYLMLFKLTLAGAKAKYGPINDELRERLRFEFDVIQLLGLADYFLIVHDFIDWARSDRGYPTLEHPFGAPGAKKPIQVGPGRGSAAGSAIAYCLDITRVEPLASGLLFERFLDTQRIGMPDIDVDFERDRRDEVYLYGAARYDRQRYDAEGNPKFTVDRDGNRVPDVDIYAARIGAFQGMKTGRAVLDAARIHKAPIVGRKMADLIPKLGAEPMPFSMIFEEDVDKDTGEKISTPQGREFREYVLDNVVAQKILATARAFEGVTAGDGMHAAGVVISDVPLNDLLPMRWQKTKAGDTEMPIVLWDGVDCDRFGLLKLDALGLVNLDYVAACLDNIELTNGIVIDPYVDIPHPDTKGDERVEKAFALLRAGRTQAIFQLSGSGITDLTMNVAPTTFEDLSAILALYRPGPMGADMHNIYAARKNHREAVDYSIFTENPVEQEVITQSLDATFGTIVYQEQLMDLGLRVANFDAAQRNLLRKAVSKKNKDEVAKARAFFFDQGVQESVLPDGTRKPAFARETLETLWVAFEASAAYLFNKSHTIAYGYLSYLTAYLKANYPTEYTAAVLAVEKKDDRRFAIIADARDEGIEVRPPDVNKSGFKTMPDPDDKNLIWFGLGEVRDVKSNASSIIERRGEEPYKSLHDLMQRNKSDEDKFLVPANAVEGMIESGALDAFGPRLGHMLVARVAAVRDVKIPTAEWGELEKSNRQRFRLGFAVGDSLMDIYSDEITAFTVAKTIDPFTGKSFSPTKRLSVEEAINGNIAHGAVVGYLASWSERVTRAGARMANFTLEGRSQRIEGCAFPQSYSSMMAVGTVPAVGSIVALTGELKKKTMVMGEAEGDEMAEEQEITELYVSESTPLSIPNDPTYADFADVIPFDFTARRLAAIDFAEKVARKKAAPKPLRSDAWVSGPDPQPDKPAAAAAAAPKAPAKPKGPAPTRGETATIRWMDWRNIEFPDAWSASDVDEFFRDDSGMASVSGPDNTQVTGGCGLNAIIGAVTGEGECSNFVLRIRGEGDPTRYAYLISTGIGYESLGTYSLLPSENLPLDEWTPAADLDTKPTRFTNRVDFYKYTEADLDAALNPVAKAS